MKKCSKLFFLFAMLSLFISCGEEKKSSKKNKAEISYVDSVLFYENGSLWTENADGEMVWFTTLSCGVTLKAYPAKDGSTSTVTESKNAIREGEKEPIEFTKVRFNDGDYWIQSALIIPNSKARVTTGDDIHIYNSTDITSVTNTVIPEKSIIAYQEEVKDEEFGNTFAKITYKDSKRAYRDVYIKAEFVSANGDDVIIKRILSNYNNCKNETVKKELYANICELNSSSLFAEEIKSIKNELYPETAVVEDSAENVEETESFEEESSLPETVTTIETDDSSMDYDDYYEFE